jgi:hypothetical protein
MRLDQQRVIGLLIITGVVLFLIIVGEAGLREILGVLAGGAIGMLLVYGYERWIKG